MVVKKTQKKLRSKTKANVKGLSKKELKRKNTLKAVLIFAIGFLVLSALTLDMTINLAELKNSGFVLTKRHGFGGGEVSLKVGSAKPEEVVDDFYEWTYNKRPVKKDDETGSEYWGRSMRFKEGVSDEFLEKSRVRGRRDFDGMFLTCNKEKPNSRYYDEAKVFKDQATVVAHHVYGEKEELLSVDLAKQDGVWRIVGVDCN